MGEVLWRWLIRTASSSAGMRWAFTWAFLEAILLPLPPEILLIPLALANPTQAPRLACAAVVGSLSGGSVSYWLGWRHGEWAIAWLKRLPGVNAEVVLWTSAMLKRSSMPFIALSPWLVVPYKIASVLSGHRRIAWWRYLLAGAIGRGTRIISLIVLVSWGGVCLRPVSLASFLVVVVLAYTLMTGIVWSIRRWLLYRWTS